MSFDIPIEIGAVKLVAMICRIGAFIFAFPFFSTEVIPVKYKILIAIALAFAMTPCIGEVWGNSGNGAFAQVDLLKMATIVIGEALLGVAIALIVEAAVDIFAYAGTVMDMEVGFNASSEFDPSGETRTLFSYLLVQLFMMVFLTCDMHLEMLKITASSFQTLPPGAFTVDAPLMETMIKAVSSIFLTGIQVALPVMASMFMINLGMAVLSRIGEDFPVMVLSFAIHLGVGIVVFGAILPTTLEICRENGLKLLESLLFLIAEH